MDRKKIIKDTEEEIRKGFDQWFSSHILEGRPPLLADVSVRHYPYSDLIHAYTQGITTAMDIMEDHLKGEDG